MSNLENASMTEQELREKINQVFSIYDIQHADGNIYFFGTPKEDIKIIFQKLWPLLSEKGFQFTIKYELGEHILIASPFSPAKERLWINYVLAIATIFMTMIEGSYLFGANPLTSSADILKGLPFTIAIMTVLGAHEAGHYIVAKKHGMQTSLPYFIPFPNPIGTIGAVIRHRGPIPSRKALFDVGISGPIIGLIVSIIVTAIGLLQPPIVQTAQHLQIELGTPLLFELVNRIIPTGDGSIIHYPIAFAGWVGMLVTALNLIPAGQLDGGHVLRAMIGEKAKKASRIIPFILISLGFYITVILNSNGSIWVLWGIFLSFFAAAGHPKPLNDDIPLGKGRMALGIITFFLGLLCFTLVPFQIG